MDTKQITAGLVDSALGVGGAFLGQELGSMLPATINADIVDAGKVVVGIFAPALLKGDTAKYLKPFGIGLAAQGGLNLINKYMMKPTGYQRIGYPMNSRGLAGNLTPGYPVASAGLGGTTRAGVAGGM